VSLQQRINDALKEAMLAKQAERLGTLRLLKSALGYAQIEKKSEGLPDAEVAAILQRELKKRRDAAAQFEQGGRPELAAKENAEAAVIEEFLPQPLPPAEAEALVRAVIAEVGATSKKDLGAVIRAAQARAAGRADGKTLSTLASRLLP
jgi:uncharacterized protein YqeY